ncbi:MAG TPA: aldo/keto reductase [Candidatus Dormibacteraeota bacterium]|nr:aldo/keto reductase [Candidatus Dormibacteraeota bacterium]
MNITRRTFTKRVAEIGTGSILALAGCTTHAGDIDPGGATRERRSANGKSNLRRLGNTDLTLSRVGFGAQHNQDPDLIRYALDQGINHIETSWLYGMGGPRSSCKIIGKAISGRRDSVRLVVAYEAMVPPGKKFWLPNQFEQTLRELGTDHIDVFLWHHPGDQPPKRGLKESQAVITAGERVELMLKWKAEGKIRWCGVTFHDDQEEWVKFVAGCGLYQVAVVAFNYNSPEKVANALREASLKGVGVIAMKTQSPNYLATAVIGDAPDHGKALGWVLSKEYITAAIPGMTAREQVDLNLQTMRSAV